MAEAATLLEGAEAMGFHRHGRPGIRAQLVERTSNRLVMDFVPLVQESFYDAIMQVTQG